MAVIKCKMCGGDLDISEGLSVCECEYCGTKQTVPTADNEKKLTLFARANRLRLANEFDKAAGVYETIVADFPEEAEAYWGLVLCRYGIEYVDDPATGKKVPTCHRVSFDSVLEDTDFEQSCENADAIARRQYREEAKQIEDIRRGIIEVSGKEEPYDIFICYKETDENGDRTIDSVIAQDIYDALTEKGYRVFFSRISLEDKLGTEYEPYIFAALNSAKIMLAFGTDYEYYNAVWVKNEWSRFLKLMEKDKSKHLIPCYKGIDAYDMPKEFQRLQGQDMGKVGAVQDLLRGIEKITPRKEDPVEEKTPAVVQREMGVGPNVGALLQRGSMALEDGEWNKASEYFDQVLNIDAQNAEAYLGLSMAEGEKSSRNELAKEYVRPESKLKESKHIRRARKYGNDELRKWFKELDAQWEEEYKNDQRKKQEETLANTTRLKRVRERIAPAQAMVAAGMSHCLGLRADGTVLVTDFRRGPLFDKGQCDVSEWQGVVAVSVGDEFSVGLLSDGTVITAGLNSEGQCNVSEWRDTVAISAGYAFTVGLRSDGTVVATKYLGDPEDYAGQCDVAEWKGIVAISSGSSHTVGLRSDGTVVTTDNDDSSLWQDIVAVSAGGGHTVGMHSDGTVVATGLNSEGQCNVSEWRDIVAISAGEEFTVGLRADGTVIATGDNSSGQCNVSEWRNIVAISASDRDTVGLRSDGTVIAVGESDSSDFKNWKLFNDLNTLKQEREKTAEHTIVESEKAATKAEQIKRRTNEQAKKRAAEQEEKKRIEEEESRRNKENTSRWMALLREKSELEPKLQLLDGFFNRKRRKEVESRLAAINIEIKQLEPLLNTKPKSNNASNRSTKAAKSAFSAVVESVRKDVGNSIVQGIYDVKTSTTCPRCGTRISKSAIQCPVCGRGMF